MIWHSIRNGEYPRDKQGSELDRKESRCVVKVNNASKIECGTVVFTSTPDSGIHIYFLTDDLITREQRGKLYGSNEQGISPQYTFDEWMYVDELYSMS